MTHRPDAPTRKAIPRQGLLASAAIAAVLAATPALAQQQGGGQQQPAGQQGMGQAVSEGAPLYVSPADVGRAQEALNQNGFNAGNIDGIIGNRTIRALCNYQQDNGLEPTGNLNPQTIRALGLNSILSGQQGRQAAGQRPEQEQASGRGAPLYISPATVRQVEQALNESGYEVERIDGRWNQQSSTALRNYQQAQGMEPTGSVDLPTLQALGVSFRDGGGSADQTQAQDPAVLGACQQVFERQQAGQGGGQQQAQQDQPPAQAEMERAFAEQEQREQQRLGEGGPPEMQSQIGQQTGDESMQPEMQSQIGQRPGEQPGGGQQLGGQEQAGTRLFLSPATIRQVEQALNEQGYEVGEIDGIWDQQGMRALSNFQQAEGMEQTGNLNTRTIAALGAGQELSRLGGGGGSEQSGQPQQPGQPEQPGHSGQSDQSGQQGGGQN